MEPRYILVILPSWVGDVVMATPALRALRGRYPAARITYLQRPYVDELLAGSPWHDAVAHWAEGTGRGWRDDWRMLRRLAADGPDLAVLFPNSFRAALAARLSGARRRVGYARDGRSFLLTDRLEPQREAGGFAPLPMLDYYRALAERSGAPVEDERLELHTTPEDEARLDERLDPADARPLLVLNPGAAYGMAKCWPAERYAAVADYFSERHGMRVVATCAPNERPVAEAFARAARLPHTVFCEPPLGLGPLKALIRRARLMITNDTGPRHFAAAFNVPVVTIFGSSDPAWTETRHPRERQVMTALECQPCMQRVCPLKHHHCMVWLPLDAVRHAAETLLAATAAGEEPRETVKVRIAEPTVPEPAHASRWPAGSDGPSAAAAPPRNAPP